MARHILPSASYLRQCLDLNMQTGDLTWKSRPREHFQCNRGWRVFETLFAGKRADVDVSNHGYRRVGINGRRYAAHRIVWKMVHGVDPEIIDHINRDKTDNRPVNLRVCTAQQNRMNVDRYCNNRSGRKGVHLCNGKWRAMIRLDGRSHHIGLFETLEDASEAYEAEAMRLFGDFAAA